MDPIRAPLEDLLNRYGTNLYRDRRRFVALLRDTLSRQSLSWRFNLLILSIDCGQLEKLIAQSGSLPLKLLLENHSRAFSESYRIQPEAARWVIETWIQVFELSQPQHKRKKPAEEPMRAKISKIQAPDPSSLVTPAAPVLATPVAAKMVAPNIAPVAAPDADQTQFTNGLGMVFVRIDRARFLMGSPGDEAGRDSSETQHEVTLSRSFYLQATPVTQAQWRALISDNPSARQGDSLPVEKVSWEQCQQFINALCMAEPFRYRLPTEAEWELAARAGRSSAYFFGTAPERLVDYAWFAENAGGSTRPVGEKRPSPIGLFDIYGNVREWCADWFGPYSGQAQLDPVGPQSGAYRVCRGGSWRQTAASCRSAARQLMRPGVAMDDLGFRLVMEI